MSAQPAPVALARLAGRLRCPTCHGPLHVAARTLTCRQAHSFDIARQGYVALRRPHVRRAVGDTPAMVAAREAFLAAGHYRPIADALATTVGHRLLDGRPTGSCVVDLGAGTGYQLAVVLDHCPQAWALALDASPPALRRAARAHPRIAAIACDTWQELPLADAGAGLVINSFAPRNGAEIHRVLDSRGALIVVRPTPVHLHQLSSVPGMLVVDPSKSQRLHEQLSTGLRLERAAELQFDLPLARAELEALVMMGPSAHHVGPEALRRELDRRAAAGPVTITVSVVIETFSKRSRQSSRSG